MEVPRREPPPVRRNVVFFENGSMRSNLPAPLTQKVGEALQRHLRPEELGRIAGLAIARQIRDNQIERRLQRDSEDEVRVKDHIGRTFPSSIRRSLHRALESGFIPTARRGQVGGSWAVSAEALVTYAARTGIPMDPFTVVGWYNRAVGREIASTATMEIVMSVFDGSSTDGL